MFHKSVNLSVHPSIHMPRKSKPTPPGPCVRLGVRQTLGCGIHRRPAIAAWASKTFRFWKTSGKKGLAGCLHTDVGCNPSKVLHINLFTECGHLLNLGTTKPPKRGTNEAQLARTFAWFFAVWGSSVLPAEFLVNTERPQQIFIQHRSQDNAIKGSSDPLLLKTRRGPNAPKASAAKEE